MNISKRSAMQIVDEISGIINQHVNMMDAQGIIIASTDPARVGTFHGGAAQVIEGHLDELIIKKDEEYSGTKAGINLPILFEENVIGVIGITGDYDQVVKYGQIIKKMTEILLRDTYRKEQKSIDERLRERYLDEWIFGNGGSHSKPFLERGYALGIDISLPRRVLVAELAEQERYNSDAQGQRLLDKLNKTVKRLVEEDKNKVFHKTATCFALLVPDCTDAQMSALATHLCSTVLAEFGLHLNVGIDSRDEGTALLRDAYLKAEKALRACLSAPDKQLMFYNDIGMELFMGEIPKHLKAEFVRRIFRGCSPEEISVWVPLLTALFDENGSIGATAQRLFMHKNTLQYKLKRLHEKTGHDPRLRNDSALFYLAIQFYKDMQEDRARV